jgi:hypothetical protein
MMQRYARVLRVVHFSTIHRKTVTRTHTGGWTQTEDVIVTNDEERKNHLPHRVMPPPPPPPTAKISSSEHDLIALMVKTFIMEMAKQPEVVKAVVDTIHQFGLWLTSSSKRLLLGSSNTTMLPTAKPIIILSDKAKLIIKLHPNVMPDEAQAQQNDPFFVLGLRAPSTFGEINSKFYELCMMWHPDQTEEDESIATAVTELLITSRARCIEQCKLHATQPNRYPM